MLLYATHNIVGLSVCLIVNPIPTQCKFFNIIFLFHVFFILLTNTDSLITYSKIKICLEKHKITENCISKWLVAGFYFLFSFFH